MKGYHRSNRFFRLCLYGDIDDEEYSKIYNDMMKSNASMLHVLSVLCFIFFSACWVLGQYIPSMTAKLESYGVAIFSSLTIIFLSYITRKSNNWTTFLMYALSGCLLATGLFLTLIDSPDQFTITLIPISVMVPLFYEDRPWKVLILILVTDLLYLCIAPFVKPTDILIPDIVNVILFSAAGIIIGTQTTRNKLQRYVYAHALQVKSITDELTGCYNRSDYEESLHILRENGLPSETAVIMIDLNGLKQVNDRLGHKAGDELIVTTAEILILQFGAFGKCYRIGGDEFAVIVPLSRKDIDTRMAETNQLLETYHGEYVSQIFIASGSITAAEYGGNSIDEMIKLADLRMYESKAAWYRQSGRERRRQ